MTVTKEKNKKNKKKILVGDLTTGNVTKKIMQFAMPVLLGNLLQQFYNLVDSIIVGRCVGKDAFAAVGSTGAINFMIIGFVLGTTWGVSIPVAQKFGAKDFSAMRKKISDAIYVSTIIGIVITILTVIFTKPLLELMNTPSDIIGDAALYIGIIFAGIPAILLYNIPAGISRAIGDSKTPLYFLIFSACLNVVLDLIFVLPLQMGVAGTAIATVISQAISGILCIIYMKHKHPFLKFEAGERRVMLPAMWLSFKMGAPMGMQFSITAIGSVILQTAINGLGSDAVASINAASKLQLILVTPMDALGASIATYCGQNYGAGNFERIKEGVRKGFKIAVSFAITAAILANVFAKPVLYLFVDASEITPQIVTWVRTFMLINSCFYVTLAIIFIYRNAIQGLGRSAIAMLAGVAELVGRSFAAIIFVQIWGFTGVCFGNILAWILADAILIPSYIITLRKIKKKLVPGSLEIDKRALTSKKEMKKIEKKQL